MEEWTAMHVHKVCVLRYSVKYGNVYVHRTSFSFVLKHLCQYEVCSGFRNTEFTSNYSIAMRLLFQLAPLICMMALYFAIFRAVKKSHAVIDKKKGKNARQCIVKQSQVCLKEIFYACSLSQTIFLFIFPHTWQ